MFFAVVAYRPAGMKRDIIMIQTIKHKSNKSNSTAWAVRVDANLLVASELRSKVNDYKEDNSAENV